jgi:hypothetical protein
LNLKFLSRTCRDTDRNFKFAALGKYWIPSGFEVEIRRPGLTAMPLANVKSTTPGHMASPGKVCVHY